MYLPVAGDSLNLSIVSSQGNVESDHSVASLDQVEVLPWDFGFLCSSVEEELDLFQKSWLLEFINLRTELFRINCSSLSEFHCLYTEIH